MVTIAKKKQHTLKSQVAIDEVTGQFVDGVTSVPGPTADITVLEQSSLLARLPQCVGTLGDLAYVGMDKLHPTGRRLPHAAIHAGKTGPPKTLLSIGPSLAVVSRLNTRLVSHAVLMLFLKPITAIFLFTDPD